MAQEFLLADFIAVLRRNAVRISPAESIEAGRALQVLGWGDKGAIKQGLAQLLAKSRHEKEIFGKCFEAYFARHNAQDSASDKETALDENFEREMMWAGEAVGIRDAQVFTQQGLFIRRIMEELGEADLRLQAEQAEGQGQSGRAQGLRQRHDNVFEAVKAYVEKEIELRTKQTGRQLREQHLSRIALNRLEQRDYHIVRGLIEKMAQRLASRLAPQKKRARKGQFNLRDTLRHNFANDGHLVQLFWRSKKRKRAKLLVLCDVSGSVSAWSRFLLSILYALRHVIPHTRAFVFSDTSGEVTDFFASNDLETAFGSALRAYGNGSSDYGRSLNAFAAAVEDSISPQTTIIILGDARSNMSDPGHRVLARLSAQARNVFWLNPEQKSLWGTGDSEMPRLGAHCRQVYVCQTLQQLETISGTILQESL